MDKHQDTLIKLLLQASHRYDLWRVFSDFLFASAAAISNAVDLTQAKAREEQYKKVMERYDKETRMLFPQMMAELTLALQDAAESGRFRDVLGDTFHQLNLQNEWKGQFFTPLYIWHGWAWKIKKARSIRIADAEALKFFET